MSVKNQEAFWQAVFSYVQVICIACPLFALTEFAEANFVFRWRDWLTRHCMRKYWSGKCFYTLARDSSIDHPDQRICEDVNNFTSRAYSIIMKVIARVVNVLSFIVVLWNISPTMVVFLLAYCTTTTLVVTFLFGERLENLEIKKRIMEADFRFCMMRSLEHSEEIAFYNGGTIELSSCLQKFNNVMTVAKQLINVSFILHLLQYIIEYLTVLLPYLFIAERYFAGEIEFGAVTQTAMAFRIIQNGLNVMVTVIARLSALAAETERIHTLLTTLEAEAEKEDELAIAVPAGTQVDADVVGSFKDGAIMRVERTFLTTDEQHPPPLVVHDLQVLTPDRRFTLWNQLEFTLQSGHSILIMGLSGCGKSSLLRAIAGLFTAGAGWIEMPEGTKPFFLPQKPYIPSGSLKDQLLYGSTNLDCPNYTSMESYLEAVGLSHLLARVGGWHTADIDFATMLSLGEQQRIAIARLLCCAPTIAFLDECTSALDEKNEAKIYSMVQKTVPCFISVGHRKSLMQFHTHVLHCHGNGNWQLTPSCEIQGHGIPPLQSP